MNEDVQVLVPAKLAERKGRGEWKVQMQATRLAAICGERADYHDGRREHWAVAKEEAEQAARESGMTLHEQQVTGGPQFAAHMDTKIASDLKLARDKFGSHQREATEYRRWEAFLSAMGGVTLELSREDFHFFQPKPEDAE